MRTIRTWIVSFGYPEIKAKRVFYTDYHAEQFARALWLNGTPYTITESQCER